MPQTSGTFTGQTNTAGPANLPGGVSINTVAFSFSGTQSTFDIISPTRQVVAVDLRGAPIQTTDGTASDQILLTNTMNSAGKYTLIAASTNGADVNVPTILRASRSGTNGQDAVAIIISKGG